jgi:hypothetical protein
MRSWSTVIALAAVVTLTAITAAPVNAASVRPSKVSLTDGSGATNGCVAKIPSFQLGTFRVDTDESPGVHMNAQIKCPATADVRRLSFKVFLFEVRKNGTLRGMNGPEGLLGTGVDLFDAPLTGVYHPYGEFGVLCGPENPQNAGKRTWLVRAVFHTRHSTTDPVAFVAELDRQQVVDCH